MWEVRAWVASGGSGTLNRLAGKVDSPANLRLLPILLLMSVRLAVLEFIFSLPCRIATRFLFPQLTRGGPERGVAANGTHLPHQQPGVRWLEILTRSLEGGPLPRFHV